MKKQRQAKTLDRLKLKPGEAGNQGLQNDLEARQKKSPWGNNKGRFTNQSVREKKEISQDVAYQQYSKQQQWRMKGAHPIYLLSLVW